MDIVGTFKQLIGRTQSSSPPPPIDATSVTDMRKHVQAAYAMLCDANKRAIQVPPDVVHVITAARKVNSAELPDDLEPKFWNAYGLLSSSIQPADRARRFYRNVFYVVLIVLLFGQFFYLSGDYVRGKLTELDKQVVDVRGRAAAPGAQNVASTNDAAKDQQLEQIRDQRVAYYGMGRDVLDLAGTIAGLPLRPFGYTNFFAVPKGSNADDDAMNLIVRGKLDMLLVFLSGYLLPMLYGLLGACAFVLRKLSDEIDKLTFANDARVRYTLRLNIGLLSGLAVGWFIKPGAGEATLVSLSPLALAFIAGYGSDLFFVALDKLVGAFASSSGSSSRSVSEVTAGGIVTTTTRSREAHVAGPVSGADDRAEPAAAPPITKPAATTNVPPAAPLAPEAAPAAAATAPADDGKKAA